MDKTLKSVVFLISVMLWGGLVTLAVNANADGTTYKRATISAENTFTDAIKVPGGSYVNVSIKSGDLVATIVVQRQFLEHEEGSSTWRDVDSWDITAASEDQERRFETPEAETVKLRIGCKTGDYTSGSAPVRLGSWQGF